MLFSSRLENTIHIWSILIFVHLIRSCINVISWEQVYSCSSSLDIRTAVHVSDMGCGEGGGLETDRPQTYHCYNCCCSCGLYLPFQLFCPLFLMGHKDKAVCVYGSFVWMWFDVGLGFPTLKGTVSADSGERWLSHTDDFIVLGWCWATRKEELATTKLKSKLVKLLLQHYLCLLAPLQIYHVNNGHSEIKSK